MLRISFVDKTVNGLPVSIRASTGLDICGVFMKKVTKGKGFLLKRGLIEQRILGNVHPLKDERQVSSRNRFYEYEP